MTKRQRGGARLDNQNAAPSDTDQRNHHYSEELRDLLDRFRAHLHVGDEAPVVITLAAAEANFIPGHRPCWRGVIGSPSSGKTEIVKSLANGVDPDSGEVFPAEGAYQRPQTVRALFAAAEALERAAQFERRKQQLPAKTGEPWSEDEDRKLLASFDAGHALGELAAAHQRTQTGIRARLVKYGRLAA